MHQEKIDEILGRSSWDKNRGIRGDQFSDALKKAAVANVCHQPKELGDGGVKSTPGTDIVDPYSLTIKPHNVPVWDMPPLTPREEAIYYGVHIHSESNPFGLHSHVKGGKPSGGHSHGPQNRFGGHHHKKEKIVYGVSIDGIHTHEANHADGCHRHSPENFG